MAHKTPKKMRFAARIPITVHPIQLIGASVYASMYAITMETDVLLGNPVIHQYPL